MGLGTHWIGFADPAESIESSRLPAGSLVFGGMSFHAAAVLIVRGPNGVRHPYSLKDAFPACIASTETAYLYPLFFSRIR
jgi:hypothetical protein